MDVLLTLDQFKMAVPNSLVAYLAYGTLIHYETLEISICNVCEVSATPHSVLTWDAVSAQLDRMDHEVCLCCRTLYI